MLCGQWGLSVLLRGGRTFCGLGLQGQSDRYSERNIFKGSFTEKGTVSVKAIFEGGLKFSESEARKKFNSTASPEDKGDIGEWLGSDWGESDQAIDGDLWEIRSTVINELESIIIWHSVCMSWNSVYLHIEYTWQTQDGP